ncbi:MAG: hypothetical protein ACR2NS_09855 [Gemmatimonadaceae bacterium]
MIAPLPGIEFRQHRDPPAPAILPHSRAQSSQRAGEAIDTSMGLTPTSGLVMSTRPGDLDPGLVYYLARAKGVTAVKFQRMVTHESELLGVLGISPDLRELLAREHETSEQLMRWRYSVTKRRNGSAPSQMRTQ